MPSSPPSLLVPGERGASDGARVRVTPTSAGWRHVGFEAVRLAAGSRWRRAADDREVCAVLIQGRASVRVDGRDLGRLGERRSPFDGRPFAVYAPAHAGIEIEAISELEIGLCSAPGKERREPRVIAPGDIVPERRGEGANLRIVHDILPQSAPADSLLVVEVVTPAGNWSSYPPHKHDAEDLPEESLLEETYYHRIRPDNGFAFQRVYTDDRSLDETMTVHDGDCVMVPRGYHPVGAPHGYDLYYLNVMAGPRRLWRFRTDPDHAWLLGGPRPGPAAQDGTA